MPRPPRPVNPDEGPLQSFAHDLRELREKTGNPTYRALAKKAGYSATTLSEAAGGIRRPNLEVTLAFVGACGGDLDTWRLRWLDLVAAEAPPTARLQANAPPEPPCLSAPAPPPRPLSRWSAPWWTVAAAVVVLAAAVVALAAAVVALAVSAAVVFG